MRLRTLFGILVVLVAVAPLSATPKTYTLHGRWHALEPVDGNGKRLTLAGKMYQFDDVYCLAFPAADSITRIEFAMFNQKRISLTVVPYPEKTTAYIVSSTLPAGRDAEEDVDRLLANLRRREGNLGVAFNLRVQPGAFGRMLSFGIRNVLPESPNGPFPLETNVIRLADAPVVTMSVHRLFVRGPDRLEVAILQVAPPLISQNTEQDMAKRLTAMADAIVNALEQCTQAMPIRVPKPSPGKGGLASEFLSPGSEALAVAAPI